VHHESNTSWIFFVIQPRAVVAFTLQFLCSFGIRWCRHAASRRGGIWLSKGQSKAQHMQQESRPSRQLSMILVLQWQLDL
jgi:hypothetical protein